MSLELSPSAADEVRQLLRQHELDGSTNCLRVGINGFGPMRRFTLSLEEPDLVHESIIELSGIRISFSKEHERQLDNVTIDCWDVGGTRGFVFNVRKGEAASTRREVDPNQPPPNQEQIQQTLRSVIDPEVGINIVDLGLVYGLNIDGRGVHVTMTMTTPACPMTEQIKNDINNRIAEEYPGVEQIEVEVVWQPPWGPEKISPEGKQMLGWSR
ncbi:MAG TPA: iron-sulfur cluster assembly protein [Tepidisphaeraceae bacterium]|nr:iron-sulfur cluster assembly protein [Tepidisphaeraceae bacterium]